LEEQDNSWDARNVQLKDSRQQQIYQQASRAADE
jgi:hypothetical protein